MGPEEQRNGTIIRECEVKEEQDKIVIFMTAIMSRREGGTGNVRKRGREKRVWRKTGSRQNRGLYDRYNVKKREGERKRGED